MIRLCIFTSLGLCMSVGSIAQDNTFFRKFNLSGMQGGLQLEATADGGFIATGQHQDNGSAGSCDVYVYRVDACGNNLWYKLIGNGDGEGGKSIKQTADGGYIVACHYAGIGALIRMNDAGDVLWSKAYSGTQWVFYADETANGDFICLAHVTGSLYAMRTTSAGDLIWSKRIDGMGSMGYYIAELPNGDFIFTSTYEIFGKDMGVGRISANGNFIFGKTYGGSGYGDSDHTNFSCKGLLVDNGSAMVVTSPTYVGSGGEDILLMKVSTMDGSVIWSESFGGGGSDQSRDITLHPHGYAIVGNTNSFPVSASSNPDTLSQDMGERDVLLLNVDFDGNLIWARTYGGNYRDRGIGVSYNLDNGFTMSAFSNSSFFGVSGDSMDPIFIKTDSLGLVTCQVHTPPIMHTNFNVAVSDAGGLSDYVISAYDLNPVINDYTPNDTYLCQSCYTEPIYNPSDTIVCVNEQVNFINTTSVGLTCFQNWEIEGQTFSGELDTLTYSFDTPGLYEVVLYSTCGANDNVFTTNIHVYETTAAVLSVSDYNGFEVSCFGADDGAIEVTASGGYLPSGSSYHWQWLGPYPNQSSIDQLTAGEYVLIVTDTETCADTLAIELNEPPLLTTDASVISDYNGYHVSCFNLSDGEADVIAAGGVAPYSYSWSAGSVAATVSGLSAGTYSCTVIDDNNCEATDQVNLNQPDALQGQITLVSNYNGYEVSCFGASDGQAVFNASGGVMPYSILWNNQPYLLGATITGLSQSNLNFELIDLNGCTEQLTAVITQPPLLSLVTDVLSNYGGSDVSCPGAADGQCIAIPSGGVLPYQYEWEDGSSQDVSADTLTSGSYSVIVMDANGCSVHDEVVIEDPEPIALTAQITSNYNGYQVSCFGANDGLAAAQASGAVPPFTYWWSNGSTVPTASALHAGLVTVFATDNHNCDTVSVQLELNQPDSIRLSNYTISDYNGFGVSCPNSADGSLEAEIAGGVMSYNYSWSNGYASAALSNLSAGEYTLAVTDLNNCVKYFSFNLTESDSLSIQALILPDTCLREVGSILLTPSGGAGNLAASLNGEPVDEMSCCLINGAYTVRLIDANGCVLQESLTVSNVPGPVADFSLSAPPYCSGETEIGFYDNSEGQVVKWIWSFDDGSLESGKDVNHLYKEPGVYQASLSVTDINQCVDAVTAPIIVNPELRVFIPNSFTPDQNGLNEGFFPDGSSITSYDMIIYNRWGDIVFRSSPETPKWNGSVDNANLSSENGVYAYRIIIYGNCESREVNGHILLIR